MVFWAAAEMQAAIARRVVAARVRHMRVSVKASGRQRLLDFGARNVVANTLCVISAHAPERRGGITQGRFPLAQSLPVADKGILEAQHSRSRRTLIAGLRKHRVRAELQVFSHSPVFEPTFDLRKEMH